MGRDHRGAREGEARGRRLVRSLLLDAGTGSSALTWQGMAGIGYTFKWGNVLLAYRHLYYDQKGDKLVQDMRFSGPALGASFRF